MMLLKYDLRGKLWEEYNWWDYLTLTLTLTLTLNTIPSIPAFL